MPVNSKSEDIAEDMVTKTAPRSSHRRLKQIGASLGLLIAASGLFYAASPHKTLLRRWVMPGYWWLAVEGKTCYDPELHLLRRGNPALPEVAITIDDGPHPENCVPLLDALKAAHAPATFYVVGSAAKAHPELIQRMVADGNEVGNHTQDHLRLPPLSDSEVRKSLGYADINVRLATNGYRMKTLRPPGGEFDARTAKLAHEMGYTTVLWSDTSGDYEEQAPGTITREVMDGAENGAILLLHDAHAGTVQALPMIIRQLREKGFRLVTVSEMIRHLDRKSSP